MLHIILLILKIMGCLILGLLVLILLLVLTILVNPIHYRIDGACNDSLDSLKGNLSFSWLFRLICGEAHYKDGSLSWKLRIFRKKIGNDEEEETSLSENTEHPVEQDEHIETESKEEKLTSPERAEQPVDEENPDAENKEEEHTPPERAEQLVEKENPDAENKEEEHISSESAEQPEQKEDPDTESKIEEHTSSESAEQPEQEEHSETSEKKFEFEDRLISMFSSFVQKLKYTFEKLCAKMNTLIRKKDILMRFLSNEAHKQAFLKGIGEIRRLLKRLKPAACSADIDFGCENPAHTGYILAIVSMIYPMIGEHAELRPDFEKKIFQGEALIEGNIRLIGFLIAGCNMILNKNVRLTFRHVRQLIKQL